MSQRVYYEIDGHIHGPISLTQLQLMAASGMLQPHHRIRREGAEQWFMAQTVRGLFAETPAPAGESVPQPVAAASATGEENPFGPAMEEAHEEPGINAAFDFFSDPEPAPAPPPPPVKPAKVSKPAKPTKPVAAEPLPFEPVPSTAPNSPVAEPTAAPDNNPFNFATARNSTPAPAAPQELDEPIDLPEAEALPDEPPAAPAPAPKPAKSSDSRPDSKPVVKIEAANIPTAAPGEVLGRAVELLPDDSLRLMDGKTSFRLHRAWLIVTSKFADGSARTAYIRLQRIDAGILDQRSSHTRSKTDSHSLLAFIAGDVRVGLVFQGSDKPYRAFLEKALLLSNASGSSPRPAGKI